MNKLVIYGLKDPRDDQVHYVGSTVQALEMRLTQHIYMARSGRVTHRRAKWICEVIAAGHRPEMVILETTVEKKRRVRERWWVKHLRKQGLDLMNSAPAGVGSSRSYVITNLTEIIPRFGKESDEALAAEYGVTRKAISYHRRKLGIPAFAGQVKVPPPYMGGRNRTELPQEIIDQIGTMPDYKLAEIGGTNKRTIARCRREMGLPSWAEEHDHPSRFKKGQPHPRWGR